MASPNSKTSMGSKDSLDSKSGSASKTSLGSKDSLDTKPSPNCKSRTGSRDSLNSKTATENKASKTSPNFKIHVDSKSSMGSKDDLDPLTLTPSDSKTSFNHKTSPSSKPGSELNLSSDVLSSSKPGPTHFTSKPSLVLTGLVSPMSSRTGLSGPKDSNPKAPSSSAKPSPDPKVASDSSKPGPIRSSSKSAIADLSTSSLLSPRPSSASRSPGSAPRKTLGSSSAGPNRGAPRSPGAAPGLLTPLATSSPKTRTTLSLTMIQGPTPEPTAVTSLTRGLTFDTINRTSAKTGAAEAEEHLKPTETKVGAAVGLVVSQGAMQGVDVTDNAGSTGDKRILGTPLSKPTHLGDTNAIPASSNMLSSRATGVENKKEEKRKQERSKQKDVRGSSSSLSPSSSLHPLSTHPARSKTVRETATMTDPTEILHLQGGERREVGIQVEGVEHLASTSSSLQTGVPSSSLIGSPNCSSGALTSPTAPSLCCVPAGQPPFQHVCKIDIELRSQSVIPSVVTDRASSLPACLRTYSFQQSPALTSELQLGQKQDVSAESIWEDDEEGREGVAREQKEKEEGVEGEDRKETEKPQEVAWDKQGRTWEVYGASVDLESLGTAIQSHLESKIREQEKHIRTLRKSVCSDSSLKGYKMKKRKKRRGGILGCCRKAPAVAD
ncbi:G protein-regulated inducer of neurite outgrowth 1 [Centropristis striata]|uniref:G protein-regulated inducer of neurite outgrowth 1 n=1 Tax=Centropristis striata TaxID=184440 RepID=UPI0027E069D1|nr:G protein-regulated inducer of neurite outgrowth 1 [Centropristis striata]